MKPDIKSAYFKIGALIGGDSHGVGNGFPVYKPPQNG